MKLLSNADDSWHPPLVNKVTHDISSNHIDATWMQTDSHSSTSCKIHSNLQPIPKPSVLIMLSNVHIHRQVPISNA